jgi:hypothetical protein
MPSLLELAHTSQLGPNNPGQLGTGFTTGPNAEPLVNMQLGNPIASSVVFNSLEQASHNSIYGPYNTPGQPGAGFIPDPFANIPPEL